MRIVRATEADIAAIAKLEEVLDGSGQLRDDERYFSDPGQVSISIELGSVYVAKDGTHVVGTITFCPKWDDKRSYWISAIVTAEEARGRDVGTRLLDFAYERARKKGIAQLELCAVNGAGEFFAKYGFQKKGIDYILTVR